MIHAKMYQFKRRWKIVTINKPTSKIKFALFVEKGAVTDKEVSA